MSMKEASKANAGALSGGTASGSRAVSCMRSRLNGAWQKSRQAEGPLCLSTVRSWSSFKDTTFRASSNNYLGNVCAIDFLLG